MGGFREGLLILLCFALCWRLGSFCCDTPPRFHSVSDKFARAPPGQNTAVVSFSAPSYSSDCDGNDIRRDQIDGPSSGSRFREGATQIRFKVEDHDNGQRDYTGFNVRVSVDRCSSNPVNQYFAHGTRTCQSDCGEKNVNGAECSHSCYTGYRLSGTSTVRCQGTQWNPSTFPKCNPVSCGTPKAIAGGSWICNQGKTYGERCVCKCKEGYSMSGVGTVQCQSNGQWSSVQAACHDQQAPKFSNGCPDDIQQYSEPLAKPALVTWNRPSVSDNSGGSVTVTNTPRPGSSFSVGRHEVLVTARDAAGNEANCTFTVTVTARVCPALVPPTNGDVHCPNKNLEGSQCTYNCSTGYEVNGRDTLLCTQSQQWDAAPPDCTLVSCGQPTVRHGVFTCEDGVQYQDACTLKCNAGFRLQGPVSTVCTASGTWSGNASCLDIAPPTFPFGCPSNIQDFADRLRETTRVNWTDPEVEDNSRDHVQLVSDVTPGDEFPLGVTSVTYTATDLTGNVANCSFDVEITVLNCNAPEAEAAFGPDTVTLFDCPNGTVFGATCGVSCLQGYPMTGETSITCERDDSTYPPTMVWQWPGADLSMKPTCVDISCPKLNPPKNGALACFPGTMGYDCFVSCDAKFDVPKLSSIPDGRLTCPNSLRRWIPSHAPDCSVRVRPNYVRVYAELFYNAASCDNSTDAIRQAFIERMKSSDFADACVNVVSCVAENVEVSCGTSRAGRRRRSTDNLYNVAFDIHMGNTDGNSSDLQYQDIINHLNEKAKQGHFDLEGLTADEDGVGLVRLECGCPPGSACSHSADGKQLSCRTCSAGYYMPEGQSECFECPVGTYQDQEIATSCTQCPPGMSTESTGSGSLQQCKELCKPGYVSHSGFEPCQPCAPGFYQALQGQRSCHRCPLGTYTRTDRATGRHQCVSADYQAAGNDESTFDIDTSSAQTVAFWVYLRYPTSAFNIKLLPQSMDEAQTAYLLFSQTDSGVKYGKDGEPHSLQDETGSGAWFHMALATDIRHNTSSVYLNGKHLQAFSPIVTQRIAGSISKGVLLSGLLAVDRVLAPEEVAAASRTCTVDVDRNLQIGPPSILMASVPSTCDAVDDCASSPCGVHPCENQLGGYTCHCQDGWTGDQCQTPPNHCLHMQCTNNATCVSSDTDFTCLCPRGYMGRLCHVKTG